MSDSIDQVFISSFIGSVEQDIVAAIYDLNGRVAISTNKFAQVFKYNHYSEIVGKTTEELYVLPESFHNEHSKMLAEMDKIRRFVISSKRPQEYFICAIFSDKHGYDIQHITQFPLFLPNGEVVGTHSFCRKNNILPIKNYIHSLKKSDELILEISDSIKLSPRQQEVLLLMMIGYSQHQIGDILGVTRGTIAKVIAEGLCPKLGLPGSSAKYLVEKALELKLKVNMPLSLIQPKIILFQYSNLQC